MNLRILGCSGGIGAGLRTTSFLLDDDILIDAGTGVQDLSIEALARIDHVFLSHSHLDHIAALPLMIDSVGSLRNKPVIVYALPETIQALRDHIFNWTIWPDFSEIQTLGQPWMAYQPISIGASVELERRQIIALEANHTVPALGFHLQAESGGSLVFSGDTGPNPGFWKQVNAIADLKHLIVETAFSNHEQDLATVAKHLYPDQLAEQLELLSQQTELWITHLKPSDRVTITREVRVSAGEHNPNVLVNGQVLRF